MYTYLGNHVNVSKGAVYVNGDNIYSPAGSGRYTGKNVRITWLVNWHDCTITTKLRQALHPIAVVTVTVAGQSIVSTPSSDVALQVATNLNNAFVKPAGAAVNAKNPVKVKQEKPKRLNKKRLNL